MCGIAGFYSPQQLFNEHHLAQMTNALHRRGPDAEGRFCEQVVGLGHRRLSILDLSTAANQPMVSADERYVIAYNGEVYNFQELRKQLDLPLRTQGDTEVILELFARQNLRAVYQFNGIFAIAIYDRVEQALYLMRDRMGVKPLYYYWDEQNFAFASELKGITILPHLQLSVNTAAIADYLHLGYVPAPQSIYRHVYKLKAGAWLKISPEGLHIGQYWDLNEKIYPPSTWKRLQMLRSEPEAKAQLNKLLQSAVNYQMVSDVPLGVFLSGGIDSSTVAALAVASGHEKVKTFSIGFKEAKFNEAEHARAVAKHLGTDHHEELLSVQEAQKRIASLVGIYDEPFADSSALPTLLVSEFARKYVTVALGGDGGDELFLGYGMYAWAARLQQPLWRNTRHAIKRVLAVGKAVKYQKARSLFNFNKAAELHGHIFSQEQFLFSRQEVSLLLTENSAPTLHLLEELPRDLNAMERQALFDMHYYLPDDLLVKVDRASMWQGLEARVPLLDHRVVEFALNLSPALKHHKGTSKYLLKQVLFDYVPARLFDRPKQGFSIPLADWLRGDLKYLLDEYLSPQALTQTGILKPEMVAVMRQKFDKGNSYFYNRLWALVVLQMFLMNK